MRRKELTPLAAAVRGALAGAAGTAAMDLVWYNRYKQGGGQGTFMDFESTSGQNSWEDAPEPAQVARRIGEGFLQQEIPPQKAGILTSLVHWSYGSMWGALYGLAAGSATKPRAAYGLILGPVVWSTAYVVLPPAKLYEPIWKYDVKTLTKDLSAHLAYGTGTAVAFRTLTATRRQPKATDRELAKAQKEKNSHKSVEAKSPKLKALSHDRDHQPLKDKALKGKEKALQGKEKALQGALQGKEKALKGKEKALKGKKKAFRGKSRVLASIK